MNEKPWLAVINDEEQYSIWSQDKALPDGWKAAGFQGTRQECLEWIDKVWLDMRPRSLRERMVADAKDTTTPPATPIPSNEMPLVDRLCECQQQAQLQLFHGKLEDRLKEKLLHLAFSGTMGNTTVGIKLQEHKISNETLSVTGTLTLDFVSLLCKGRFDVITLEGLVDLQRS